VEDQFSIQRLAILPCHSHTTASSAIATETAEVILLLESTCSMAPLTFYLRHFPFVPQDRDSETQQTRVS
jgi:hypothetical protein